MVSTRGLKFKFSEGERVLCYEPDPTKAKVLYDSKVLEVKVNKDQRGRKAVEFLIHFQGWNSSWDRCVTEDYILKDTEDNRQLQKDLAHKAQLQLRGSYLYRRDRTKRRRKAGDRSYEGSERRKRRRTSTSVSTTSTSNTSGSNLGGSDNEDSGSSHEEDGSHWDDHDSDNSSLADNKKEKEEEESESEHREEKIVLELSAMLRKALERDSHLITKQNKVAKLPAVPDVVSILEEFVKHYATTQLTATTAGSRNGHSHRYSYKYLQHHNKGRDLAGICRNLNICKEVADGLRIYFDFTLKPLLLYEQELAQSQHANNICPLSTIKKECGADNIDIKIENFEMSIKQECDDGGEHEKSRCSLSGPSSKHPATSEESSNPDREAARRRSLRSHKAPDPPTTTTTNGVTAPESVPGNSHSHMSSVTSTSSRCSTISPAPVVPSISGGDHSNDNVLSSPRSKTILSQVSSWRLIPEELYEQMPAPPSLLYGAIHLTRLFIRLPDLLSASGIPTKKLKILQTHLENFLGFLEDHPEWFDDVHYEDADQVDS